jgi:hypothetical protein
MYVERYYWDELATISAIVGIVTAIGMVVWFQTSAELGWIGIFYAVLLIGGVALHPRMSITTYDRVLSKAHLVGYLLAVLLGYLLTAIAQTAVIALGTAWGWSAMAAAALPTSVETATRALAAMCETVFLFWFLQPALSSFLHPAVGVLFTAPVAGFFHLARYGYEPLVVAAVVVSFYIQSMFFEATHRVSVPLGIHLCVNLIPLAIMAILYYGVIV